MVECATCHRPFKTLAGCAQHCKDKGHTYVAPGPPTSTAPRATTTPSVTPGASPAFECQPCCLVFANQAALDEHKRSKHPPPARFSCEPCAMTFSSAEALSIHLRFFAVHPKCPECNSAFVDQTQLDMHTKLAHPAPTRFKCGPCAREIPLAERQKHFRDSPNHPVCFVCDEGFLGDSELNEHLSSSHLEFRCTPCRRQLRSVEDLQQHYLTSPMHPHCALCEMGFIDDIACDKHMEMNHPRPQPRIMSPTPAPAASSSLDTQRSTQSSPLVQRPPLNNIIHPATSSVLNERSELDDDSYETIEASSHVQRAVSEPTLPTASSLGPSNVQDGPPYASRSPTISEQSYDGGVRRRSIMRHTDSESTLSLRSVSSQSSRSYIRSPAPSPPSQSPAPRSFTAPESADDRSGSGLPDMPATSFSMTPDRRPSVSTLSERIFQQASRAPSRETEQLPTRPVTVSSISRPATPVAARTPLRSISSRPLSRVSVLSTNSHQASPSQKPSTTAVDPPSVSDSEGTVEAPTRVPKLQGAVRASGKPGAVSWHCRGCMQDPCVAPTATMCGHIFCSACIIQELSKTGACPACGKLILLRLHVEAN